MSVPSSAPESVAALTPAPLVLADVSASLRFGLSQFRTLPLLSSGLSALFVAIGLLMFAALEYGQIAPMSLSLAGGFMLVGPILLAGFFSVFGCFFGIFHREQDGLRKFVQGLVQMFFQFAHQVVGAVPAASGRRG